MGNILAFETSCDDTAVAIINSSGEILSNKIYSQVSEYELYGGVVPEVGSRAHIEQILALTKLAFYDAKLTPADISAVAATFAPGLVGPLLVGAHFAKGLALAQKIPLIAVHHIAGHVLAGFSEPGFPEPPFLALIASGGHTAIYLCASDYSISLIGETLDDAAGEAFDKIGRALGLGYPAGKKIDDLARGFGDPSGAGDPQRFKLPVAMRKENHFNFSFSGLKTQSLQIIKAQSPMDSQTLRDICAGVQEAIAQALVERMLKALTSLGIKRLVIGGGVAANSRLREVFLEAVNNRELELYLPPKDLCTDNAVMIARAALIKFRNQQFSSPSLDVRANLAVNLAGELYN